MVQDKKIAKEGWVLLVLFLGLLSVMLVSFSVGRYSLSVPDILRYLFTGQYNDDNLPILMNDIRLPRILAAVIAGGGLSVAGAAYQGLFRNPMVSPDILGVSQGAGFGAALAILLSFGFARVQLMAFAFGLVSVFLVLSFTKMMRRGRDPILMLVLSGMIVGSLFNALISLAKFVADSEYKLPDITFWLMGSLSSITIDRVIFILPVVIILLLLMYMLSWRLNIFSFGEEEAKSLGIHTGRLRITIIACASLLTATIVSITGLIGWVGLIIPHAARFIVGPNHRFLIPASFLLGAAFLLLVDDLARSFSSLEIPLGIITSIIGAPLFFVILIASSKKTW